MPAFPDRGSRDHPIAMPPRILAGYWSRTTGLFVDPRPRPRRVPHPPRNGWRQRPVRDDPSPALPARCRLQSRASKHPGSWQRRVEYKSTGRGAKLVENLRRVRLGKRFGRWKASKWPFRFGNSVVRKHRGLSPRAVRWTFQSTSMLCDSLLPATWPNLVSTVCRTEPANGDWDKQRDSSATD